MAIEKKWVLVDLHKLTKDIDAIKIFGSVTELQRSGEIKNMDGKKITIDSLYNRLRETDYWQTDKYIVCRKEVRKSKRSK